MGSRSKMIRRSYRRKCERACVPTFRMPRRPRRSILDLIFLPPFLIMDELMSRLRELLHVG